MGDDTALCWDKSASTEILRNFSSVGGLYVRARENSRSARFGMASSLPVYMPNDTNLLVIWAEQLDVRDRFSMQYDGRNHRGIRVPTEKKAVISHRLVCASRECRARVKGTHRVLDLSSKSLMRTFASETRQSLDRAKSGSLWRAWCSVE